MKKNARCIIKYFLATSLILFYTVLSAQQKLTIELNAGVAVYPNTFDELAKMPLLQNEQRSASSNTGALSTSLLLGYKINNRLQLKAGIGLQERNFSFVQPPVFVGLGVVNSGSIQFLSLPIRGQYEIIQKDKLRVFLFGGVTTRISSNGDKQLFVNSNKRPNGLENISSIHNYFLNGRNMIAVFNGDSSLLLMTNYYQYNKVDFFANTGAGASYQIGKRLVLQVTADYNFQLSKSNFFGKYRYEELYRNGGFVGVFEETTKSARFRENFFTINAGLIYSFK